MERTKQRTDEDELVSIISKVTELRKANPGLIRGVRDLGTEIEVIIPNGIIKVKKDANKASMYIVTESNKKDDWCSLICQYETIVECLISVKGRLFQISRENVARFKKGWYAYKPTFVLSKTSNTETYPSKNPRILSYLERINAKENNIKSSRHRNR
tara:strand:+ start:244 stop:714 length:471 start_codon:yes stop_codon:yes gene_type:complete